MAWRVEFEPRAKRELDTLDSASRERILKALSRLAANPYKASNVKALHGGSYRLRVGDYRAIYVTENDVMLVLVVKVGHRREVYR